MDKFLIKKIQVVRKNTDEDNLETEKNSSPSVNASSSFKEKFLLKNSKVNIVNTMKII